MTIYTIVPMTKEPPKSKLPKRLIPAQFMSYDQIRVELVKIKQQLIIIHDLHKRDGLTPIEYMHETLEGLRSRCIELHWQQIELIKRKYK